MKNIEYQPVKAQSNNEFYKISKFLFLESEFKTLHLKSKALLMFINDKFDLKKRNNEILEDDKKNKYIEYNEKDMAKDLKCSVRSISNYKKELTDAGLIYISNKNGVHKIYVNENIHTTENGTTYIDSETNEKKYTFFSVPKYLFHNAYKNLTWESIFIYVLIKDRYLVSLQNKNPKYIDENNRVFAYFSYPELQDMLNISKADTVKSHKNKLLALNLLKEATVAHVSANGKTKRHLRYYVLEPIALPVPNKENNETTIKIIKPIEESDNIIWEPESNENTSSRNNRVEPHATFGSNDTQNLGVNNTPRETPNNNTNNNNDMYDMYIYKDKNNNSTNQSNQSNNQSFVLDYKNYKKKQITKYLPDHLGNFLNNFEVDEIKLIKDNLFKAKKSYENNLKLMTQKGSFIKHDKQTEFTVEDLEMDLTSLMKRLHGKRITDNESIQELNNTGYIFSSIKAEFIKAYNEFYNAEDLFKSNLKWAEALAATKKNKSNNQTKKQYQSRKVSVDEAELDALGVY
ncbi:replication initiator protein A [Mammaliicoccus lentus]|uniref:replication initiator protein A n=1 Tax=Mammaliicoccus lentus TaxID=42858 RepID=UPI001072BA08|nr:replication initiator protein A [Mammaliicoccus lentus]MBF0795260.1 replication initiator protein A [Mammaliicoccus lentus]TFV14656.1 hypothetical protein E4T78_11370 [Mammaliicoccus lentus]